MERNKTAVDNITAKTKQSKLNGGLYVKLR